MVVFHFLSTQQRWELNSGLHTGKIPEQKLSCFVRTKFDYNEYFLKTILVYSSLKEEGNKDELRKIKEDKRCT